MLAKIESSATGCSLPLRLSHLILMASYESFYFAISNLMKMQNNQCFGNLMKPQHAVYEYIDKLENIFIDRFPQVSLEK